MGIGFKIGKFVAPVLIIGYLLWRMPASNWQQLSERPINYPVLAAALGVAMVALFVSFLRWWMLVRCQGIPLSLLESLRLSSICFLLSFVSAGSVGGDLFKAVFLARRSPGKRVAAVASVFVDRGSGMYGLLLLVSVGLIMRESTDPFEFNGLSIENIKWIVGGLLGTGTAVLLLLVLGGKIVDRVIQQLSGAAMVGPLIEKIGPPLRAFHHHPWAFGLSLLMSVCVQGCFVVSMYLIATSMYAAPPTLAEHFVIVPIGMLASALPITPAGIGVLEVTIETLYHLVPARATDASGTLVALVFELVKLVIAGIGTVFYWTAGKDVQESLEYAEEHPEGMAADSISDATA
ncbi:lysylphosphatidylglycerol synthase transmembrane domain-containing protein [Allorhodopirellula heiligendammensis]|uniref:lysylphosphatidylglycerol synthase transmembrane domain-containing protein n=1 Tax=Allorhodopirellula heiligendammensis TaxID=2714739 RepID=UPI00345E4430